MALDFSNYTSALQEFYEEASYWNFAKITNDKEEEKKHLDALKKKARQLNAELKNLPQDMVRPLLIEHINKALNL